MPLLQYGFPISMSPKEFVDLRINILKGFLPFLNKYLEYKYVGSGYYEGDIMHSAIWIYHDNEHTISEPVDFFLNILRMFNYSIQTDRSSYDMPNFYTYIKISNKQINRPVIRIMLQRK